MPASFCDRLIPFSDKAVWLYLSIYLLMPIGPLLMHRRRQIVRYAIGIVLIGMLADIVFIFWPTSCPRPEAAGTITAYRMLTAMDNPFHAFPSLHAAFAVFSALCARQVLRELRTRAPWRSAVWFWTFLILVATLLTKQHMLADIMAGGVLALGVHICVFNRWNSDRETKMTFQTATANAIQPNSTPL
jgi:membrane-associated phospholipid phosphatase